MRKGAVSAAIQAISALIVAILIMTLVLQRVAIPSLASYGNEQAEVAAQSIASSVNALSDAEEGVVEKILGVEWNIRIFRIGQDYYIKVIHDNFESSDVLILGKVTETTLQDTDSVKIIKRPKSLVSIEKPD